MENPRVVAAARVKFHSFSLGQYNHFFIKVRDVALDPIPTITLQEAPSSHVTLGGPIELTVDVANGTIEFFAKPTRDRNVDPEDLVDGDGSLTITITNVMAPSQVPIDVSSLYLPHP